MVERTVGRYDILREVGRGGMATVYLARQIDLDRRVALKELGALRAEDPSFVKRFLREAQLAGSLSHPNVVTVHDYFEYEGVPYIAMEYVPRGSVRPWVGRMSPEQIGGVLRDSLAGLGAAEEQQIVHRDMKPENLMVTNDGRVKIADFGIAKATNKLQTGAFMTSTGIAVGTPNYIAPEQARGKEVGAWTDLYALGVMAFEFYVGKAPFADTEEPMAVLLRHVNDQIPTVSDLDPRVDTRISRWIEWLVSKKPSDRPQSAREAWDALEESLIASLGPQWARRAPLLAPEELPPAAPVTPAAVPAAAVAPAAFSERTTGRLGDPLMAGTLPPTPRTPPIASAGAKPGPKRRWRTWVIGTFAGVAVIATIAAAASQPGGQSAAPQPTAQEAAQTSPATGASGAAGAVGDLQSAPEPSAAVTKTTLEQQAKTARTLARNYENTATRIERLGSQSSQNTALVAALRQTGGAYRAAGTAASAGDTAAYTAAIASAGDGKKAVQAALGDGSGTSTTPTPAPSTDSSNGQGDPGGSDEQSDDPSDDEGDGSSEP